MNGSRLSASILGIAAGLTYGIIGTSGNVNGTVASHHDFAFDIVVEVENTCPWDCQVSGGPDGSVGIQDFLALLGQWSQVGTSCDFGLGGPGVGIDEFLEILAHWGACP